MASTMSMQLKHMELGEPQSHEQLTVFPLKSNNGVGPAYLTLSQALSQKLLKITEVDEGGSVSNLKVKNKSRGSILILEGEELVGAKQNRVLNTTILLKEKSVTVVPVSCTEEGRWGYKSRRFALSDAYMSPSVRHGKVRSVSGSVRSSGSYKSDQGAVWSGIELMARKADVSSSTCAMRDVFGARENQLGKYVESVPLKPGQTGMLVLVAGKVVGFDNVSRAEAFAEVYPRLLKGYAMDAMLSEPDSSDADPATVAQEFLDAAGQMECTEHESVGYGTDCRFTGDSVVGSALEVDGTSVHAAFFRSHEADQLASEAEMKSYLYSYEEVEQLLRERREEQSKRSGPPTGNTPDQEHDRSGGTV